MTRCRSTRGQISLTDTLLDTEHPQNRPTTTVEQFARDGKASALRNAQAACRLNCCGSKFAPFFHRVKVMAAIFRARVRRAMVGRIPTFVRACGKLQTVKSRKGNRRFPISPELVDHLKTYLRTWRPNGLGLLFATGNGTPWDHSLVRKRKFHPLLRKLGVQQCGFHAFRHGNATLLDQINAPMAVRLNRLGHAEAQTTMNYTHAVTSDERKTADDLGKFCTLMNGTNSKTVLRQDR